MDFGAIAHWIAGGAAIAMMLAAGVDLAKRRVEIPKQGVLLEARAASVQGAKWILLLCSALALFAFVTWQPLLLGACVILCGGLVRSGRVVLRVGEAEIEHHPILPNSARAGPRRMLLHLGSAQVGLTRITGGEVDRLEWDGFDNLGIRLRDGSVEVVSFGQLLPAEGRDAARRAILAFVERATGRPLPPPPEPALDVAPWVVHKPPHPLA